MEIKCQLDATEVFYCRSYCLLNMFRAPLCRSSGAQEYYTVVAACGVSCCGFSSCWSGAELRVMCPVCRMLQHKMPTRCKRGFLLQFLLLAQHVSGHHCAHHQELKSIIQWLLPVVFRAVVFQVAGLVRS